MKALSLTQPWASLVQRGSKSVETRSWYTAYRGPLVIHAAKGYPGWCRDTAAETVFRVGLGCQLDPLNLPRGVGLCVCSLIACVKTTEIDKLNMLGHRLQVNEITFGDFSQGRWAWALKHEYNFADPIPAVGALGLWEWEHGVNQAKLKSSSGEMGKCANVSGQDAPNLFGTSSGSVRPIVDEK